MATKIKDLHAATKTSTAKYLNKYQGEKEDEMVGWHHRLKGHEFEQALRDTEAWRAPSPWGHGESDD